MSLDTLTNNAIIAKAQDDFSAIFADIKYNVTLASGVAQQITVPNDLGLGIQGKKNALVLALIKIVVGKTVWVARNTTATLPSGTISLCDEELISPVMCRAVYGNDTLSFITSETNAALWVGFYSPK